MRPNPNLNLKRWMSSLTLAGVLICFHAQGAVDLFLLCGSAIRGESQDYEFRSENAVDILAWNWGASVPIVLGQPGKASFQELTVLKWVDTATTGLMAHLASAKSIDECKLICRTQGDQPYHFLKITMTDCWITSVSTAGSQGNDRFTESVTLTFASVRIEFFRPDDRGIVYAGGMFAWDILNNVSLGFDGGTPLPIQPSITYRAGDTTAKLSWPSRVGATYRITSASAVNQPFQRISEIPSAPGATTTSIQVPISGLMRIYRVDELP